MLHPGLFDTLSAVVDSERSPPLYYVLAWGWSKLFGTGEVGLRSLSALIGTLTVPVAYVAALELSSRRRIALVCAALVALNPYLVWYSQEARSYALMALFVALSLVFFARCLNRPSRASRPGGPWQRPWRSAPTTSPSSWWRLRPSGCSHWTGSGDRRFSPWRPSLRSGSP